MHQYSTRNLHIAQFTYAILAVLVVAVPVFIGQQTTTSIVQNLGTTESITNISGLYDPETSEYGPFRWSQGRVTIRLEPIGYPLFVVLHVQGRRPQGAIPVEVGALGANQELGVQSIPTSPSNLRYQMPVAALFSINPEITFTSTTFQPPGDRRQLGIVYYRVEQNSGSVPSLPAPWPATAWLISGLLIYFILRMITTRISHALMAVSLYGIILGLLNAFARLWLVSYSWYFIVPPLFVSALLIWLRAERKLRVNVSKQENASVRIGAPVVLTPNSWPIAFGITAIGVLVMLGHLLAPEEPSDANPAHNVSWGLSYYTKLPIFLQILGVVVVTISIAWALSVQTKSLSQSQETAQENQPHVTRCPKWMPGSLASLSMILFTLAPVAYSEGDSAIFNRLVSRGAVWAEPEPLDFYLKIKLYNVLHSVLTLPTDAFQIVAILAGGIYMSGAVILGCTLGRTRREALILVAGLTTIGSMLFFFRYIENYALVSALSLFLFWACWCYTEGRLSFGTVAGLAAIAVLLHGEALCWGPMILAAGLIRTYRHPPEQRWTKALADLGQGIIVGGAIFVLILSIFILDGYTSTRFQSKIGQVGIGGFAGIDHQLFVPLFTITSPFEHFTLFSWSHLGAIVQEQLLVAPMSLATIVIILIFAWPDVLNLVRKTPVLIAFFIGALSALAFSILWNPDLGPRADWDLLALPAIPLSLLAVYLLLHLKEGKAKRLALTAYLSVSFVHTLSWVLLHTLGIRY